MFSFGAFVAKGKNYGSDFTAYENRQKNIEIMGGLMTVSIIISIIYLVWMRKRLMSQSLTLDMDAFTPSDFCIMGMNMVFDDYNPDAMEKEVKDHFEEAYGINDIQYINFAFNIDSLYQYTEKYNDLIKKQQLVAAFCKQTDLEPEKYKEMCEDPDNCPEDFPTEKVPGLCGGKQVINITNIDAELEAVNEKIKELESEATEGAEDPSRREELFTGICFVVVSRPSDALKVLKVKGRTGLFVRLLKKLFGCCLSNSTRWNWERAPEPTDIFWENMAIGPFNRIWYGLFSNLFTILTMVGCLILISLVKRAQDNHMKSVKDKEMTLQEKGITNFISGVASMIVVIINTVLVKVVRKFSLMERHETITKMNVSVAFKLTIARFLNSSVILVIVNQEAKEWYNAGNLVYDATLLIGMMTFQIPFTYLFNIPGIIKTIKIW